jgi:hypothetical protein
MNTGWRLLYRDMNICNKGCRIRFFNKRFRKFLKLSLFAGNRKNSPALVSKNPDNGLVKKGGASLLYSPIILVYLNDFPCNPADVVIPA